MTESTIVPLELRRAGRVDGHMLTGLCVPYNRVSMKAGFPRGERFVSGAFASAPQSVAKIRLTDSHMATDFRRPAGVATELREAPDGLLGTFRFYDTPEGRGAYENVLEGTYGGLSVGFLTMRERSGDDGVREILEARLFHVSLVDEPAYDDAEILAVRAAQEAASVADRDAAARRRAILDRANALIQYQPPIVDGSTNDDEVIRLGIEYGSR